MTTTPRSSGNRLRSIGSIALAVVVLAAAIIAIIAGRGPAAPVKAAAPATGEPRAIPDRVPWTTNHIVGSPEPPAPYRTQRAYPKLTFKAPVDLDFAPGSDRVFVLHHTCM